VPLRTENMELGLATVDRIRRTYGSHIMGSIPIPVAVGWLCNRIQNTDYARLSITVCQTAIYGSCMGVWVPIIDEVIILFSLVVMLALE
jgi:hypothetical protein